MKANMLRYISESVVGLIAAAIPLIAFVDVSRGAGLSVVTNTSHVSVEEGSTSPILISLRIANGSSATIAPTVYTTTIRVVPEAWAVGEVLITKVIEPEDYIFKGLTPFGPQAVVRDPALPEKIVTISDFSLMVAPDGSPIEAGATAALFHLELTPSADACGKFSIVLLPINTSEGIFTSSWTDAFSEGRELPFDNSGFLATIETIPAPEPSSLVCVLVGASVLWTQRGERRNRRAAMLC